MSAGKWAVTRYEDRLWRVWDGDGDYIGTYPTWEGAMRVAHRGASDSARTITVVLPAYQNPTTINVDPASPATIYTAGPLTQIEAGGMRINLFRYELEQVALALLAHAERLA